MMPAETTELVHKRANRDKLAAAIGLGLIIALGAYLRLYQLGEFSIGNTYYAAAVKSMLTSWENFFFVAFEPGGSVTVDKPPVGFWVQAVSAYFLGVNGFALALPNALAGIGSILLVYGLVKKQFNTAAGLIAALVLAIVPVTVSTERNNTIDGLLVFVLLLAIWAVWRAVETGKLRCLLLGAALVGLGFNIKMLQAYMVLPALYALYFFGAKHGWWTRVWHLATATVLLLVVSLSWAVIVDLTPAENRPFIGSSQDNTVMELIVGHNGLSRLGLSNRNPGGDGGQPPRPSDGPAAGINPQNDGRPMPPPQSVGQPAQFPPPAGQAQSPLPGSPPDRNSPPLDGQPRPAGNQVVGPGGDGPDGTRTIGRNETGRAGFLRLFSEPLVTEASWLLPLALLGIVLTALVLGWSWPLKKHHLALLLWAGWMLPEMIYFSFTTGLFHRYYLIMLGPPLAALVGMAFWSIVQLWKQNHWLAWSILAIFTMATIGFQIATLSSYESAGWLPPFAIFTSLIGLGLAAPISTDRLHLTNLSLVLIAVMVAPFTWSVQAATTENPNVALPTANTADKTSTSFMTPNNDTMTDNEKKILEYLLANTDPDSYLLATHTARGAAPYILETGRPVLTFGGFTGSDQVIDAAGVAQMVSDGELRFVLFSSQISRSSHRDIANWVQKTCTPAHIPGLNVRPPRPQYPQNIGLPSPPQKEVLYDCAN
jgi:4-amino-4-deoxy-L-arabinose transferase-like glycosyltransferase